MYYMQPNGRFHNKAKFIESGGYYDKEFIEDEDQVYVNRIALMGQNFYTYTGSALQVKTADVDTQSLPILCVRFALIDSKAYLTFIKDRATALDLIRQQINNINRHLENKNCYYLSLYTELFFLYLKYNGKINSNLLMEYENSKVLNMLCKK
ncbi:hypothetical protein DCO58_07560 [Helicobacter saguini]|uniref:Uncharacterized protein n=1 Tax=Helicobacter saguini TaxID=1548018 RepID=A0A347VND4_9HELI|nr:hypothetical protein [Helicobacter saguini]MWV61811.1 hypothetical protein [Helicobacter saguini]MWV67514.1 hypothetical protein [Helicobacter saguini]MWV69865.1 hypothetical protein [Helicobacter saguini]MWV72917.1 hypothetical protein [Helicobacter saguini]TLD93269.1 hypothetical protein LS64_009150 [Helicobacter saguini]